MSVLVQRLGRLRDALRLGIRVCDNGNHPRRVLGAPLRRKHNTSSTACSHPGRVQGFPVPSEDNTRFSPEKISENTYAHNLFLNSMKYANTVMQPSTTYAHVTNAEALMILQQDWSSMTSAETVSAIKKLSYNFRIHSDDKRIDPREYTKVFDALNLQNLSDDDLITVMRHLVPFSSSHAVTSILNNLLVRIDRECIVRFSHLPANKKLYLCDIIYQMTSKIPYKLYYSQYVWYSIRNLGGKPHKLSPQQLVQILFFLNVYRKPPINMYELEFRLEQCLDDLSINELAVAALGFFKTSTKIRDKNFLIRIIQRTINEIDMVDTISIAAIIKLIRYSTTLSEMTKFIELLKVLTPYESRYTLMSLAHIGQACARIILYHKDLMDRLIARLSKEVKTARLKDFERFLYTFSIFNIDSNNSVYQNVIEELRTTWNTTRAKEIERFPYVAARILGYLVTQNVYPIDLIKKVMTPEHVNKACYGNYHYLSREYCVLDYSLRIEVPEYDGPFLKPAVRNFVEKKYYDLSMTTSSSESTRANLLFADVLTTCQELFNTTSDISEVRTLPHFSTRDIVFCIDEQNQLVPSEKFLSQYEVNDIKYVDKENSNNVRWIALVMGHHGLLIRYCNEPTGALASKIRQLSKIGYTPIMISHLFWNAFKSPQEKRNYIKDLVFQDNMLKSTNTIQ